MKDELIQLHTFLFHVKRYLEDLDENNNQGVFSGYDVLGVAPQNVYKSKEDHEHAVFELSQGITFLLNGKQERETNNIEAHL